VGLGTLTLTGINTYTGSTLVSAGSLALSEPGSIAATTNITIAAGAILSVSGRADTTLTLSAGQLLQGNGTLAGSLVVSPGATLTAGTNSASTGTLTVTNTSALGGATWMKLDRTAGTNDVLIAAGITNGGTLILSNISAPLQAGDSFQLFNAPGYDGSFITIVPATPGAGLGWNTNSLAVNGVLSVVSVLIPHPSITSVSLAGGNLVFSGTNGTPGGNFYLLESTNLTLPRANWTVAATNQFSAAGTFNLTNAVNPAKPALFYLLAVPTL
jgi:autotransporter-associated beta strand protein